MGVDEAGRGPLAGPVIAAAVILNPDQPILGLNDSKKLTARKRDLLYTEIYNKALFVSLGIASVEEIEEINILQATLLAMQRAVLGTNQSYFISASQTKVFNTTPDLVLVDGNIVPKVPFNAVAVIDGDALIPEISAASIIAKVTRDREMEQMDSLYPEYGFLKHKGYGTKQHINALKQFGICKIHRKTFGIVKEFV